MHSGAAIRVIEPGMLTTIQDLGRSGYTGIGVGRGGAADTLSLRAGNRLVGNDDGEAALEMTLTGGVFEFMRDACVVLTGGTVTATVECGGTSRPAPQWLPLQIRAGERLSIGPIQIGVRAYLCLAGGLMVPSLLGSRSTHLAGGFGGLAGRALRKDDLLNLCEPVRQPADAPSADRAMAFCQSCLARRSVRAMDGAHQDTFTADAVATFWTSTFEVSLQSDRTGLRLAGRVGSSASAGSMQSEGMMPGAVQVPESGRPIVLMVDHPTTGGYPVIACVAAVDHPVLGQLRPREVLRFERVSRAEARASLAEQERRFNTEVPPP